MTSVGERVCLIGGNHSGKAVLENMLREEVEKDIPFQFVDDLRVGFYSSPYEMGIMQNMFWG